jgi:amino acid transporter
VPEHELAYKAPFGTAGSYFALFFCILIALTKSFDAFTYNKKWGNFDYKTFITSYLGIPLYLILLFGYKFAKRTQAVKPHEADLWTGKDIIDQEEADFLARQALESEKTKIYGSFYKRFVSWLF